MQPPVNDYLDMELITVCLYCSVPAGALCAGFLSGLYGRYSYIIILYINFMIFIS